MTFRVGQGWDAHALVQGRALVLGGVPIPWNRGESGHSDGDALIHAIVDALLGAVASGDIGTFFPPSDPEWKDADSGAFLRHAVSVVSALGWKIGNVDATVILERPRLVPHARAIRESLALMLGIPVDAVSVKAKTAEGFGAVGSGDAVEAQAIVLVFGGE